MKNLPSVPELSAAQLRVRWTTLVRRALTTTGAIALVTCTDQPSAPQTAPAPSASKIEKPAFVIGDAGANVVLVGAGNIARCDKGFDEQTAALLDGIPGTVFTLGDYTYGNSSVTDFENCYGPSWGRHKARTRPGVGEFEYAVSGAAGYFGYFGAAAGDPAKGYYSYDLGSWHIVVLNSEANTSAGSPQEQWLKADLAATTKSCVLSYWHYPRFSSYSTYQYAGVYPLWEALYAAQADVVVNAHRRLYERFGLQTPDAVADPAGGIRQFIVGTGGHGLDGSGGVTPRANSEAIVAGIYGVLKLTLSEYTYRWEFLSAGGQTLDTGEGACHGRPGSPPPNQPPTANPGGPYQAEASVTFDGSGSSDIDNNLPLTYAWNFGDGTTGSGVNPTKTYTADGTYTATLVVTDARGLASAPATVAVTIANQAPLVNAGSDATVQVGNAYALSGSFTDAGGSADGPWSWTIAWGDGTTSTGSVSANGAPINASHSYASWGEYVARLTVADRNNAIGSDDVLVIVRDPNSAAVLVGAGDIAGCDPRAADEQTADLLDNIPGTVITLGDNAYLDASPADYTNCYDPSWGRHKARTKPIPGNHEYVIGDVYTALGYFGYFGAAAGDPEKGYYSYTAGEWLVVALNSSNGSVNRSASSAQVQWLRNLLASTDRQCVVAYMHHPHVTSADGRHNGEWNVIDLWNALYEGGVELVIAAHDHLYDRFAPMRPDGTLDQQYGIRQITVGTGGFFLYKFGTIHRYSEARNNTAYGVLKVTLRAGSYEWDFVPVAGQTYTDHGTGTCHGPPGSAPPPNQPPSASAGGPYTADNTVTFNGSGSDPDGNVPLSYNWTYGDGTTGTGASPMKSYAANGSYTASLVVTDALGLQSAPSTATVTIANVAPVVSAGADAGIQVGGVFNLNATFTDAGGALDAPWAWSVSWGDGSPAQTGSTSTHGGPITASHTYAVGGQFTVRVTVTDQDGGSRSDDVIVTVTAPSANQAPVANAGGPYQADQTVTFNAGGSSDPDNHLPLSYAWNFGDGTTGTGVSPVKTYAANGSYTATVTVTDALGKASAPATAAVTIANVEPVVNAGTDAAAQVGIAFSFSGSFTDPGGAADGPWSWTIAWGDGTTSSGSTVTLGTPITAGHTYAAAGQPTVRLTVTDKDDGSGVDDAIVAVSATAPAVILAGAGNIARCDRQFDDQTAAILDGFSGTVFTIGDNVYGATASDFQNCYGPSWGRHAARTRPAPGEMDYSNPGAGGFFSYFGAAAGDPAKGYYSYDLGAWHIIALNSSTSMTTGSAQEQWLKADLAATTKRCVLAYWHFTRFSSFSTYKRSEVFPLWEALYAAGADVVLNGHYRLYERFAQQTPNGVADAAGGIRQFTVGTGGQGLDGTGGVTPRTNSQKIVPGTYGVLKLSLDEASYSWEFISAAGQTLDSGTTACH